MSATKRKTPGPPISGRTPQEWADLLVDNVSTVTQLPTAEYAAQYPDRPALQNKDDWRRNAEALFKLAIERTAAPDLAEALQLMLADHDAQCPSCPLGKKARAALAKAGLP